MKKNCRRVFRVFSTLLISMQAFLFASDYPLQPIKVLPSLAPRDSVFVQYIQEVENSYRCIAYGREIPVAFYSYKVKESDTLFQIASRCNIPYEEIALLNAIENIDTVLTDKTIIIPNAPGIMVPEKPTTSIGTLIKQRLYTSDNKLCYNVGGKLFQYVPNERLTPTERAFFLDAKLRLPLEDSILTSSFGMRESPITGDMSFHKGIDLAAPEGTNVFACKSGVVANASKDRIYGNFVILDHDSNTQSVYAHLSEILVATGQIVNSGTIIGKVGTTGASTGPHLHFEIRVNGAAQDPKRLLPSI